VSTYVLDKKTKKLVLVNGKEKVTRGFDWSSGVFPATRTNDDYWRGRKTLGQICAETPRYGHIVTQNLKKQGVNVSPEALYQPSLASFPGDKNAVMTRADGGRCEEKRREAEIGPKLAAKRKQRKLAPDLMNQMIQKEVKLDPGLAQRKKLPEIREMVTEKYGPKQTAVRDNPLGL
jgi:hypothetical protein